MDKSYSHTAHDYHAPNPYASTPTFPLVSPSQQDFVRALPLDQALTHETDRRPQNVADLLDKHDEPEVAAFLRDATSGQAVRSGSANTGTGREQVVAEARRVLERLRDQ